MFSLSPPETICRILGERVRSLRLARNLPQQELASMAGASLSSIRRLEADGQGTINLLVRVALALRVTGALDDLFVMPVQTIAQAEAAAQVVQRQRARNPVRRADAGKGA